MSGEIPKVEDIYQPGRTAATTTLIVLTVLYVLNLMDQQVMASVLELVKKDLGLSDTQAGSLQTILYFSTSVLSIPCAIVVDRWSRRKGIGLMAIIWSLATLATGLGSRFVHLAFARFGTGIGESGYVPGSTSWISLIFSKENRAKVLGVYAMAGPVGMTLGVVLGGAIAGATGSWQTPFFVFAIPGIFLGIAVFFLPDYATVKTGDEKTLSGAFFRDVFSLFRIKSLLFNWLGCAMTVFIMFSFLAWFPSLMMRSYGVDTAEAGKLVGLMLIGGLVSGPLAGFLADWWQRRNRRGRMFFMSVLLIFAFVSSFALFYTLGISIKVTILIGISWGIITPMAIPLFFTINADVSPPRLRATSMGANTFFAFLLGGAWGPVVMGALSDFFGGGSVGLRQAGMIMAFSALLGSLFYFIGSKFYPADSEKVKDEVMAEQQHLS